MTVYLFQHQHFIKGVCLPAYFYRSSGGPAAYLRACALLQFLMTKCQSWTCNAKHSRNLQHNSCFKWCLTFPAPQGIQSSKNVLVLFFLNTVRHSNGIQLPFQHRKSNKQTCPALQFHVVQSYEDGQQNSHILPFKYILCTTYRDMPQINFPIHIYRDLFPMLCSVLFVKHWIVFPPNKLLKIARKSL